MSLTKGITIENLPYSKLNEDDLTEDREFIENYLEELALLKEVPHWYLIPDPQLYFHNVRYVPFKSILNGFKVYGWVR